MNRTILSLYIDIPKENLVSHYESKQKFNDNYDWLVDRQKEYAYKIGVDYNHFTYEDGYKEYSDWFRKEYPEVSEYNIVNFFKIKLLYDMAETYDEILYLDIDVIPSTNENFFDAFDLSKGHAILTGAARTQIDLDSPLQKIKRRNFSVRSPLAKYWNAKIMLQMEGYGDKVEVFNTGIVGITSKQLKDIDYFSEFRDTLNYMKELIDNEDIPENFRKVFGYDNETIWAYKVISNNVSYQELGDYWHHFMDNISFIPNESKLIHCVNKDFQYVRNWYEKNRI
jgi:hypothetical protein